MITDKTLTPDEEGAKISPHYTSAANGGEQHWDMMWRMFREAWFIGCVTKYLFRYRKKAGIADLIKARNYLNKLIELEQKDAHDNPTTFLTPKPSLRKD